MAKRLLTLISALLLAELAASSEVVVVVAQQSPIESLTSAQLSDIYLGRLKQMAPGQPVTPIDQTESSPAREAFYRTYLHRSLPHIQAHWSRLIFIGRGSPPRALANSQAVAELVASDNNAIGYIDGTELSNRLRVVKID